MGRGVTIGFVDISYDLLAPELKTALTLDGKPTRKIIDQDRDHEPSRWRRRDLGEDADRGHRDWWPDRAWQGCVRRPGRRSVPPGISRRRVPIFSLGPTTINGDLNRDGNPPGSSGLFAVLWNEASDTVWVDTGQEDRDFRDEKPMREYRQNYDIKYLGKDRPGTPVKENLPFQVQIDRRNRFVHIRSLCRRPCHQHDDGGGGAGLSRRQVPRRQLRGHRSWRSTTGTAPFT